MRKTLWIIIIVAVVLVLWWQWQSGDLGNLPQLPGVSEGDTTGQIQQDLEQINVGDIDQEFQNIDAELNKL